MILPKVPPVPEDGGAAVIKLNRHRRTVRARPVTKRLAALGAAVGLMGSLAQAAAAETASATYRVDGAITPAAAGAMSGPSYSLYQLVAQPDVVGAAAGPGQVLLHGWRIPAPLAQLYRFALAAGWNLKGSPGVSDRSIGAIFTGAAGAPIKLGNVLYGNPDGGLTEAEDTDPLLELRAFWVFSYWGGTGQSFAVPEAHVPEDGTPWLDLLEPGWNLFSPPYVVTVPRRDTGIAVVWRWDAASTSYAVVAPGQNLFPLEGYWIYVGEPLP